MRMDSLDMKHWILGYPGDPVPALADGIGSLANGRANTIIRQGIAMGK